MESRQTFSRENILEKQRKERERYEEQIIEMRHIFEKVASTVEGEKLFRFLFLLCGPDTPSICRTKDQQFSLHDTLLNLGAKAVYDRIRFHIPTKVLQKIERHVWEDNKKGETT